MKWIPFIVALFFPLSSHSGNESITDQVIFNKVTGAINSEDSSNISEREYDQISRLISSGDARWINLYPKLTKQPFLGMTAFQEGLNVSMAYALTKNPSDVLKFVNEGNVDDICGIPFIEPTQREVIAYYEKAKTKIIAVSGKALWKNKCLLILEKMATSVITSSNQ